MLEDTLVIDTDQAMGFFQFHCGLLRSNEETGFFFTQGKIHFSLLVLCRLGDIFTGFGKGSVDLYPFKLILYLDDFTGEEVEGNGSTCSFGYDCSISF